MAAAADAAERLFRQWDGHVVPRSFNAGFVTLSFVVSFIGAASTLELINRRTAAKGKFNHLLLVSAAVSMGGIAIWCMHYIGNRAIDLADGQTELQIAYSSGFTALSFFVPIGVLLAAFLAIGTNNEVSWGRVTGGGALAGTAICGMHYLGNASISNYTCVYSIANVVGSALIAVAASIVALAIFFVFRAAWTHSWWKRAISAVLLASAVSGMHWCASTGTQYRLVSLDSGTNELSRNVTVIVVICLSVGACFIMAGTAWYSARVLRRYATKAQQIVLAAAVFDKHGRILVSPDGLLPSERITASLVEKSQQDSFSEAHPLFHWMFRASRSWESISSLIPGMTHHLLQLPRTTRDSSANAVRLVDDHGEVIENYDTIVKELFCTAAVSLADKMKVRLTSVGHLWDEILPTGTPASPQRRLHEVEQILGQEGGHGKSGALDTVAGSEEDLAEKGMPRGQGHDLGRGSLMFLVRRVESARDTEALEAAGYRFAELHQVSGIIASTMQIKSRHMERRLQSMAEYEEERLATADGGVQLGLFGVRARVGAHGFDVLVRKDHRDRLPAVSLPLETLEPWHRGFLGQFDRMTPHAMIRALDVLASRSTPQERQFAADLKEGLESLQSWVDDSVFDEATLASRIVQVPRWGGGGGGGANGSDGTTSMIALKIVIPIHLQTTTARCTFVPLGLFKVQQLVSKGSPHHLAFSRAVHGEMLPVLASAPLGTTPRTMPSLRESGLPKRFRRHRRSGTGGTTVDSEGNPVPTRLRRGSSPAPSTRSGSTLKLWHGRQSNSSIADIPSPGPEGDRIETGRRAGGAAAGRPNPNPNPFGRIMVSQEITVQVHSGQQKARAQTPAFRTPDAEQRTLESRRGGNDQGGGHEQLGVTSTATAIELRPLQQRTTNDGGGGGREMATFVDELFAVCVDGR